MYAVLPSSRVNSSAPVVCRLSNPRGRACRPSGKGPGEEGILSDVVPVYLYCPAFSVSVFVGVSSRHACRQAAPATRHTSHCRPGPNVSGAFGQGL